MKRRHYHVIVALLACLMLVGAAPSGVQGAQDGNACRGWQDSIVRLDGTPFASKKDCVAYVEAGGTVLAPRIVHTVVVNFNQHCEPFFDLVDFPVNTDIFLYTDAGSWTRTSHFQVDASGVYSYIDAEGNVYPGQNGTAFGLAHKTTAYLTATFTAPDGSVFETSLKYRC